MELSVAIVTTFLTLNFFGIIHGFPQNEPSLNQRGHFFNNTSNAKKVTIQITNYKRKQLPTTAFGAAYKKNKVTPKNTYTTEMTTTVKFPPTTGTRYLRPDTSNKNGDVLELSASEDNPALSWPWRRRSYSRWFRPRVPTSTTSRPLEKLRKPKPTRPAMYSLDGFVPKPSLKFKPTTEAPADVLAWKLMDLQALGSYTRRNKVRFANEAVQEDPSRKFRNKDKSTVTPNKRKTSNVRYRSNQRNGIAGLDFPAHDTIPLTTFDCMSKGRPGMFADPETQCQVWHLCPGGMSQSRHSFLCATGTVFNEKKGVCDWWYNVEC